MQGSGFEVGLAGAAEGEDGLEDDERLDVVSVFARYELGVKNEEEVEGGVGAVEVDEVFEAERKAAAVLGGSEQDDVPGGDCGEEAGVVGRGVLLAELELLLN